MGGGVARNKDIYNWEILSLARTHLERNSSNISENDKQKPGRGRTQIIQKLSKQKHGVMRPLIHAH
jgi:hypothetical protein